MSAGHTPGPWVRHSSNSEKWSQIIRPENGKWPYDNVAYIAEMHEDECTKKGAHNANARLIAASPELLEALTMAKGYIKQARDELYSGHFNQSTGALDALGQVAIDEDDALLAVIDTALAKATGEVP